MKKTGIFCASSNKLRAIFIIDTVAVMVLSLMCTGCKQNEKQFEALEEVNMASLKPSALRAIKSYIAEHDTNKAFFIKPTLYYKKPAKMNDGIGVRNQWNQCFMIGVCDRALFGEGEFHHDRNYPKRYMKIDDRYVFIVDNDGTLYDQKELKKDYESIVKANFTPREYKYLLIYDLDDSCVFVDDPGSNDEYDLLDEYIPVQKVKSIIKFTMPDKD